LGYCYTVARVSKTERGSLTKILVAFPILCGISLKTNTHSKGCGGTNCGHGAGRKLSRQKVCSGAFRSAPVAQSRCSLPWQGRYLEGRLIFHSLFWWYSPEFASCTYIRISLGFDGDLHHVATYPGQIIVKYALIFGPRYGRYQK
jgi:hypothetical protein